MQVSEKTALTFDDVLLEPGFAEVLPHEVDVSTQLTHDIKLNIPLVSAAMDTVTEAPLAIAIAQQGGIGILHKNMAIEQQAQQVRRVKKYESGIILDPITISPDASVRELIELTRVHKFSGMPVVDGDQLVGIITNRDLRFNTDLNQPVAKLMTGKDKLVTVPEGTSGDEIMHLMHKNRIEKVLIVNDAFHLKGMVTVRDILQATANPNACKDSNSQLRVGAAVGTGQDTDQRVDALVRAGADVLIIDTAHGHSNPVLHWVAWIKKHYPDLQLIAGNVATGPGAKALADLGVNGIKVGMGPGSICTTRIVAGIGVPQITAIANVAGATKGKVPIIADGGVRFSGDIGKAIAAGAWSIMVGSLLAGTDESPGEIELFKGRSYKTYCGMGSIAAMSRGQGASERYYQDSDAAEKLVPQGIEGRVPYKGPLSAVVHQLVGGLRACMGYTGLSTLELLRQKGQFVRITNSGMRESHAHDITITKETPNYQIGESE